MSVYVLTAEDFGSLVTTLRTARTGLGKPLLPVTVKDRLDYQSLVAPLGKEGWDDYVLSLVEPFLFRCYIANQLAEEYTYLRAGHKNIVVPVIDFPKGKLLSLRELLRRLDALSYNVVTKGGNTFLGKRDEERLERLIARIHRELIDHDD
jgi:hypothetical protein